AGQTRRRLDALNLFKIIPPDHLYTDLVLELQDAVSLLYPDLETTTIAEELPQDSEPMSSSPNVSTEV
ncbi:MAG: hypothetical protein AB4042_09590, partial [Leptolyngbyaceae cyanobacterium]